MKIFFGILFTLLMGVNSINKKSDQHSSIDLIKKSLSDLESKFNLEVNSYSSTKWVTDSEITANHHLGIIRAYIKFGDELDQLFANDTTDHLQSFDSFDLWKSVSTDIARINRLYTELRSLLRRDVNPRKTANKDEILKFAIAMMKPSETSMMKVLNRLDNFMNVVAAFPKDASSRLCNEVQSSQQLMFNLYKTIALTEIKGYSVIQFSYALLRLYRTGGNFSEEMSSVQQQFNNRTAETLNVVKIALASASKYVWRCDPEIHKLDQTYTDLKELFQGYIINEVDMNEENTCRETCSYYEHTKVQRCFKNQYCANQRKCNGRILYCDYHDSDMWICPAMQNSSRRYEWIQYENGQIFGQKNGNCARDTAKVDSWWRWLFWHCSYCFCYCEDHSPRSNKYFSLREVVSDVQDNKVVTGVRFVKQNQIIQIQIHQSELLPRGGINPSNSEWKPVQTIDRLNHGVKNGEDYHTLSWEKRALDLDDLVFENQLLTGLKFRIIGSHLNLEIRVTPFDYNTGKLDEPLTKSRWHSNDDTNRSELQLKNPNVPVRSLVKNVPDSMEKQYLNFAPSDKEKDAAQNTIPFIDIQDVLPNPPIPISGAGIFHKGVPGGGGFIALRLSTYDFTSHLHTQNLQDNAILDSSQNEIGRV